MSDSERQELLDLIDRTFLALGGRATMAEMFASIELPPHLCAYCTRQGLRTAISSYFRRARRDDGLPQAPEVDDDGNHAQLELWTVDDCRFLVAAYVSASESNRRRAQQIVEHCWDRYGVLINLDDPFGEQAA